MRKKIYEIYEGETLVAKGGYEDIIKTFYLSKWALQAHSKDGKLFKEKYRIYYVGDEYYELKRKRPIEEKIDYPFVNLKYNGNTILNRKDEKDIDRLQELFDNKIKVTKVDDYDFGDGGRWKKEGYHFLLEVI